MGFTQFPGTKRYPAMSGPGVAQHLAHIHKEYLSEFDTLYAKTVLESRWKWQHMTPVHHTQNALNLGGTSKQQQQSFGINTQHPDPLSSPAGATPTPPPAPSTSTPIMNTSTAAHAASSSQVLKLPKGKVQAQPKAPVLSGHRISKIVQPLAEPMQLPANVGGTKRLHGEGTSVVNGLIPDSGSGVGCMANELSPPKRIKTGGNWVGMHDALKQNQEVLGNKSEKDGGTFLEKRQS
jgi:hypothetical protein